MAVGIRLALEAVEGQPEVWCSGSLAHPQEEPRGRASTASQGGIEAVLGVEVGKAQAAGDEPERRRR